MIEFNLLPTVKMDYIKAQRQRRLMFTVSALVAIVAVGLLIALLTYEGLQKKHLGDLNKDIASESAKLKAEPGINKILTVQNQLESLTALHAQKPAASNLFGYLNEVTPTQVSISNFNVDFTTQKVTVTGATDALSSVNKYVDSLKFTTYTADGASAKTKAFNNIVLDSFGLANGTDKAKGASYSISFTYDPIIFDITKKIDLTVPSITTTRSSVDGSGDLFQAATTSTKTPGSN
ncbi:MAG: hypothetical protein JWL89_716 [Candidatus Saccharibacteria bacterium]|nr:hypothetical protein [Candidatus Saccharibacteria bacterium]